MKKILFLICFISFYCVQAQDIDFVNSTSTIERKPTKSIFQIKVSLKKIKDTTTITLSKKSGDNHLSISMNNPVSHTVTVDDNNTTFEYDILVDNDVKTKDTVNYFFELKYKDASGKDIVKPHVVFLIPYQSDKSDFPLVKNDFLIFAGSNIDPKDDKSVINSTSFEALVKYQFNDLFHMRIGGYSYKSFSTDSGSVSGSLPRIAYVNTTPGTSPKVDTTNLIIQQYSLEKKTTVRSYGVYVDQYVTMVDTRFFRVSGFVRYEYSYRKTEAILTDINSKILDTTKYSKALKSQNISIGNNLVSKDNLFLANQTLNQHYFVFGVALEYSSKAFDLFFQPMFGWATTYQEYSTRPVITKIKSTTVGIKLQALIRPLDVTIAADFRSLNSPRPNSNISIGIPISFSKLKEKFK